ncbi:MAG: hypothetical protein AAF490_19340 [Chloroflexota bacterium]
MTNQTSQKTSLEALSTTCQEESNTQEHQKDSACFELFRRAFDQDDQAAWSILLSNYDRLINSWVRKVVPSLRDEDLFDEIVQGGIIRFWHSVGAKCPKLFDSFPHIGAILKYLKQSLTSSGLDFSRKQQRQNRLTEKIEQANHDTLKQFSGSAFDSADETAQSTALTDWLATAVTDPKEKLLIKLMYEYDLKPREIVQSFSNDFRDTKEVYRAKERILKRARYALLKS